MSRPFLLSVILAGLLFLVGCSERKAEIKALYVRWQQAIEQERFDEAYLLMTDDYRAKTTVEQFRESYTQSFVPPLLSQEVIVERTCIVPAPSRDGGVIHGRLYGVERDGDTWRFTGVNGGYNMIIGDK